MAHPEKLLRKVSSGERRMLQILSIFWEQTNLKEFAFLLNRLNPAIFNGYNYLNLRHFRNTLIKKEVLMKTTEPWGNGFQIACSETKKLLLREVRNEEWYSDVVDLIQKHFGRKSFKQPSEDRYRSRLLRDYRLDIYQGDSDTINTIFDEILDAGVKDEAKQIHIETFFNPFQKDLLSQYDKTFQTRTLAFLLEFAIDRMLPTNDLWNFIRNEKLADTNLRTHEIDELILKGEIAKAKTLVGKPDSAHKLLAKATIFLLERDFKRSVIHFEAVVKMWRKAFGKKDGFPDNWQMFLYGLALLKTNETEFYSFSEDFYRWCTKVDSESAAFRAVRSLEYFLRNNDNFAKIVFSKIEPETLADKLIVSVIAGNIPSLDLPDFLDKLAVKSLRIGYKWLALEVYNSLRKNDDDGEELERLRKQVSFDPTGDLIPRIEDWERFVTVAASAAKSLTIEGDHFLKKSDKSRVAWRIDFEKRSIQAIEQKLRKTGWSKGRKISVKRLFERDVENLTAQDIKVIRGGLSYNILSASQLELDWERALLALVGHPHLFLINKPLLNIQLFKGEPHLLLKEVDDDLEVSFNMVFTTEGCIVVRETETLYKIVEIKQEHVSLAKALPNNRLRIPNARREEFMDVIKPLSSKLPIHSDLEDQLATLPFVESEKKIRALITPMGEGFHVEFFVKPFGDRPPYFKPGKGQETVISNLDGVRTRTKRDLQNERNLLDEIEQACPFLASFESLNYDWELPDSESCLTAMSELESPRENGKLIIEWTKGQKLNLLGRLRIQDVSLSVKGRKNWFNISGEAKIGDDLVIPIGDLTRSAYDEQRNFIEISDGQFIAITDQLREHLRSLNSVMDSKDRVHILRAGIVESFANEAHTFKANKAWKDNLKKLERVREFSPKLPPTFDAQLRRYQTEGYFWLSRLAQWGVGACLADDMGLGKTLQALAVLVERAENGPALVAAPVSVLRNWVAEARRFAPTLKFHVFGETGDRRDQIENLGNYDVIVVSYGLLNKERELFTSKNFATIILDEAQAIKNRTTKRSKTVMKLKGDFRLVTTGTPIENHLGELWNLFNFINPGLLGSYEFFKNKFLIPIEKHNDKQARQTLHNLIKPFILRRLKDQVLDDLPEKTEIVLTVELSDDERALYESIRREAVRKIESLEGESNKKRFHILAELTRLRLACCHPNLVNGNVFSKSSKLELFGETVEELIDNKHRALVFSQFVKHLKIVEEYLREKGIKYQYLDGSTSPNKRQQQIDAFQRGSGELFLISLKAGGTGLNLTAADYVIHLDPWWNPAVEDQATDRVHRIGQKRPVTVYRLVTENTVEEKILELHETKRDLADSLLAGTDSSHKLSADDLLNLINEPL